MIVKPDKECSYSIPNTSVFQAFRKSLNGQEQHEYRLFIYTPEQPAPPEGYAVVYLLDANSCFGSFVEMVRLQTRKPHGFDPLVVVGIGYNTEAPFATECRFRDYTVPAEPDELLQRGDGAAWPKGGEAEAFLDFILLEIKPFIQQQLPINPNRQALFGHSLGGLFTMHTLLTRPFEFQAYIAASPSLWWKNGYLFNELSSFNQLMRLSKTSTTRTENLHSSGDIRCLLAVGGKEKPHMVEVAKRMYGHLHEQSRSLPHFQADFAWFEEEGHVSILPGLFNRALPFIIGSK